MLPCMPVLVACMGAWGSFLVLHYMNKGLFKSIGDTSSFFNVERHLGAYQYATAYTTRTRPCSGVMRQELQRHFLAWPTPEPR